MIDIFVFQLALTFIPGLLWERIDFVYGTNVDRTFGILLINAFLFGIATYIILGFFYWGFSLFIPDLEFDIINMADNEQKGSGLTPRSFGDITDEVLWSVPVSVILSLFWIALCKNRAFARFLRFIGASNRNGCEDVWTQCLNSGEPSFEYVHVIDLDTNHNFCGWVRFYSENRGNRELLLKDVEVFDLNGNFKYETPYIYISRLKEKMWVQFPYSSTNQRKGEKQ